MTPLLYLVHRIPYPPNKGDKIRSYNILRYLRDRYRVYLGAFIDSEEDNVFLEEVESLCEEAFLPRLHPRLARAVSLRGLVSGVALTVPYYYAGKMQRWVDRVLADQGIDKVVVFSSAMAQYVAGKQHQRLTRIIDFVDVDSDKWRQYGSTTRWPWSWVYRREGNKLLAFERDIAREFDWSTFVSAAESEYFKRLAPECTEKVAFFQNGVDLDYFNPELGYSNPFRSEEKPIVFTGAMDYWANVDAVCWFVNKVFPEIRRRNASASFYIVGSNPAPQVRALGQDDVVVTGWVADIRPFLAHAKAAVAPLRIARGIQNKVLEAMAMGCPVFASPQAATGIEVTSGREMVVEDNPNTMARELSLQLDLGKYDAMGKTGRDFVSRFYTWPNNLSPLGVRLESKERTQNSSRRAAASKI